MGHPSFVQRKFTLDKTHIFRNDLIRNKMEDLMEKEKEIFFSQVLFNGSITLEQLLRHANEQGLRQIKFESFKDSIK